MEGTYFIKLIFKFNIQVLLEFQTKVSVVSVGAMHIKDMAE